MASINNLCIVPKVYKMSILITEYKTFFVMGRVFKLYLNISKGDAIDSENTQSEKDQFICGLY